MQDPAESQPLEQAIEAAKRDLQSLQAERAVAEARLSDVLAKIDRRQQFIKLTSDILNEGARSRASSEDVLQRFDFAHTRKVTDQDLANAVDAQLLLAQFPREGYGVVTRAIETLLSTSAQGHTAKWLTEQLEKANFKVRDSHETAVRSALKNLRNQQKVTYNNDTGKYELTR